MSSAYFLTTHEDIKLGATSFGQSCLHNILLKYLCAIKDTTKEHDAALELAMIQFESSNGITDHYAVLSYLVSMDGEESVTACCDAAIQKFYEDANGDALMLNQWFMAQVLADLPDVQYSIKASVDHPDFTLTNPNRCHSWISAFCMNVTHFHAKNRDGYEFLSEMDKLNPCMSSRMGGGLIGWRWKRGVHWWRQNWKSLQV